MDSLPLWENKKTKFGEWFERQQSLIGEEEKNEIESNTDSANFFSKNIPLTQDIPPIFSNFTSYFHRSAGTDESGVFHLSYAKRFKGFVVTLLMSATFFALAFFVGLPTLIIRPHKFALCFTMGSVCFMLSFSLLQGPTEYVSLLCRRERFPFSIFYVCSLLASLYSSLILRQYALVVLSSLVQVVALAWFFFSMIPGGSAGIKYFVTAIVKTCRYTVQPCIQSTLRRSADCFR